MSSDFIARLGNDLFDSPRILRLLLAEARALAPVLIEKSGALVSSFAGVTEVLTSPSFGVSEIYSQRMKDTTGAFFLGMEPGPEYERESSLARRAVRQGDIERVRSIARTTAAELVGRARARGTGTIDVVEEFSRIIPLRVVQEYFGVPGPDDAALMRWMRSIFWEIFLNQTNDAKVTAAAATSSRELRPYLLALIQARKAERAAGVQRDDYLSRLIQQQSDGGFDDDGIRRTLGGIIVGAVDPQSKAIAHAVEQLLERPDEVEFARAAARDGDDAVLARSVYEALRFNPISPVLPRYCREDHVLGEGTAWAKSVPKGTTVFAATLAAMFDGAVIKEPNTFRRDRAPGDYLHFGLGVHRCFGDRFNDVVLPEAIKAIISLPGVRLDGCIRYSGPFPDHLKLRFDP
jgi:cytochrome P450